MARVGSRESARAAVRRRLLARCVAAAALCASACAPLPRPAPPPPPAPAATEPDPEVYRRADAARLKLLELEIDRLRADLRAAEDSLVAVESGLQRGRSRTEAVSMLAEARIQVERAAKRAPWRADTSAEARAKLEQAQQQLGAGNVESAVFFVARASRMAAAMLSEASRVGPEARVVKVRRAKLRAAPSQESEVLGVLTARLPVLPELEVGEWVLVRTVVGQVGWVHASLIGPR